MQFNSDKIKLMQQLMQPNAGKSSINAIISKCSSLIISPKLSIRKFWQSVGHRFDPDNLHLWGQN